MGTCALGLLLDFGCMRNQAAIGKVIRDAGAGVVLFPREDLSNQISDVAI